MKHVRTCHRWRRSARMSLARPRQRVDQWPESRSIRQDTHFSKMAVTSRLGGAGDLIVVKPKTTTENTRKTNPPEMISAPAFPLTGPHPPELCAFLSGVQFSESPAPPVPSPGLRDRPAALAARIVHRLVWRSVESHRPVFWRRR